jgi:hypothetical protein
MRNAIDPEYFPNKTFQIDMDSDVAEPCWGFTKKKKKAPPNIFVVSLSLSRSPAVPLAIPEGHGQPATGARERSARKQRSSQPQRPSGSQIRSGRAWVSGKISDPAGSLKPRRPSVGFQPDSVRLAGERGERESADLLKGERERETRRFFFFFK